MGQQQRHQQQQGQQLLAGTFAGVAVNADATRRTEVQTGINGERLSVVKHVVSREMRCKLIRSSAYVAAAAGKCVPAILPRRPSTMANRLPAHLVSRSQIDQACTGPTIIATRGRNCRRLPNETPSTEPDAIYRSAILFLFVESAFQFPLITILRFVGNNSPAGGRCPTPLLPHGWLSLPTVSH